jgi:hypothetical protein
MPSDELSEERVRTIVREEVVGTSRTLLGLVFWTLLSVVAALVGLQLLQMALYTVSIPAMIGLSLVGALVVGASLYLLYSLHWT